MKMKGKEKQLIMSPTQSSQRIKELKTLQREAQEKESQAAWKQD